VSTPNGQSRTPLAYSLLRELLEFQFFGTDMSSILTTNGIDTVLVTGVTSSGCVRATIVDSFSYGFRTIAIDDACGDQDAGPHDANMQDVGRRYADVIQTDDAIAKIKALG